MSDGLLSGLLAATVSVAVFLVGDLISGSLLRTPEVLGVLFLDPADPATSAIARGERIGRFAALHLGFWLFAALTSAWLVGIGELFPRLWRSLLGLLAFLLISMLYLAGAFSIPGLPALHLWLGVLLGIASIVAFLSWRHPGALWRIGHAPLTQSAKRDLRIALERERSSRELYATIALARPGDATFQHVLELADARVRSLVELCARFELPPAGPEPMDEREPADAGGAGDPREDCLAAMRLEQQKIELYDHFLLSIDDPSIHSLFLDLAAESQDRLLPELERHRAELATTRG